MARRAGAALTRSAARLAAVQALYQMELSEQGVDQVVDEFRAHRLSLDVEGQSLAKADAKIFADITQGVVARQVEVDRALDGCLALDWPLARLEAILRALLRAAAYELVARGDIPARVVVSEYVDIAMAFFGESETSFANGVLDRLARDIRATEFQVTGPGPA